MSEQQDRIRVLRLVEYEGPRDLVEKQVSLSLHGSRNGIFGGGEHVRITAVTIGEYPEIIERARTIEVTGPAEKIVVCTTCLQPLDAGACKNRRCRKYVED